ncbi:MAG: hypothetical protein G3M70_11535 [Candidatus Nitronauta litoralis]|uniref:Uncharacterized protein n=1 Tax=Candidatus Nitronauta litoralis TaxID=2705533 RepID=A0A7T0BZI2_9BACT|nr:MAG: hypothetical protein G3M70_11535 [Candidatus Nitronauta litoralis]
MQYLQTEASADQNIRALEVPQILSEELTEWDYETYRRITTVELNEIQEERIRIPKNTFPRQDTVVAMHWHPEFIPMEMIRERVCTMFPNKSQELIIPTNHNILNSYDGKYTGVEVDCFARPFNRKVQILLHFENSRLEKADVLKSMLKHTLKYRSSQLFELIHSIVDPNLDHRLQAAGKMYGADDDLLRFVKVYTRKLERLLVEHESETPQDHIKNKLLANYFDQLREIYDDRLIKRAQFLIQKVKKIVKKHFSPDYFYAIEEFIEETRMLGGGIVIPHPEQFWPILLAEYDVDGIEAWNPQSQEYTEFLINVVNLKNKTQLSGQRPILIFMGDDCHLSEKIKEPQNQNKEKVKREVGFQPAWDDLAIRKSLIVANMDRQKLIEEYLARLG